MTTITVVACSSPLRAPARVSSPIAALRRRVSYSSSRRELLNTGLLAGLKSDAPTSFRDGVDQQISADQQGLMAKILKSLVGLVLGGYPKTPPVLGPFQTIGIEELAIGTENRIRAKVFYPAKDSLGKDEAPYLTGGLPTAASYGRLANFPDFMLAHLADAKAGCFFNAPPLDINADSRSLCKTMADDNAKLPVLIYSHGYGGNADMATYAMREISSRGVVVFAIEHTDGSASRTVLEDGTVLKFGEHKRELGTQLEIRAREIAATFDVIAGKSPVRSDQIPSQLLDIIDTNRIFAGGHSFGCPSVVLASKLRPDDNFRGGLMHDPAFGYRSPPDVLNGAAMPTFHLLGDGFAQNDSINQTTRKVAANSPSPSAVYHLLGSSHGNYVDAPLWAPFWVMRGIGLLKVPAAGPVDPLVVHKLMAETAVDFISAVERGTPDVGKLEEQNPIFKALP